jgi:hypothetical protein
MSAWDPWWVHGDYAETYHGAPDEEDEAEPEEHPEPISLEDSEAINCEFAEDNDLLLTEMGEREWGPW